MKILILNPAYGRDFCKSARWFCKSRGRVQRHPDFLCEAAAVLEQAGHLCRLVDGAAKNVSVSQTRDILTEFCPEMVVIQATTPSIYSDLGYAKLCKETAGNNCLVVMAGAHVSAEAGDTLEKSGGYVSLVARGEYDYTLRDIADGKNFKETAGISYIDEGRVVHNPERPVIENLDLLPFPAWRHIDPYDYHDAGKLYPFITLMGGRGCNARCTFCLFPQVMYGNKYRVKSPERVVDEIQYDFNLFPFLKEIMFEDDTLISLSQKERIKAVCNEIIDRRLKISWSANARADLDDLDILKLMKDAGCRMLCVGYEFGSQVVLNSVKKGVTVERMKLFSHLCKKAKIRLHGCFMIGGPGETKETAVQTIEFAEQLPIDTVQFSGVCAYPGTEFYNWCKENDYIVPRDWTEWVDEKLEQRTIVNLPGLSNEDINKMIDKGLRDFYLRPAQIFRMAVNIASWADVKTKFYGLRSFLNYFNLSKKRNKQAGQQEWNGFWKKNQAGRFVHISWSKRRILKVLDEYIKPGMDVLDAGCGSGFFSNYFIAKDCNTYSLDYAKEALSITKKQTENNAKAYLSRDLLDLSLSADYSGRFDLVFSDGLFEHFSAPDQNKIMTNFKQIKKTGGVIITVVPNRYSLWTLLRPFFMPHIKEKPFTIAELEQLHKRNNCEIIKMGGLNFLPNAFSLEKVLAGYFGMLLFCVSR